MMCLLVSNPGQTQHQNCSVWRLYSILQFSILEHKLSSLTVGFFIGMAACGYFSGWASWLHRGLCWMCCDAHHSSLLSLLLQKVCLLHLYHLFCQIYCMRFYTRFYTETILGRGLAWESSYLITDHESQRLSYKVSDSDWRCKMIVSKLYYSLKDHKRVCCDVYILST